MSRYTEYLKEKVWCKFCKIEISKGQREPHLKRKKHRLNVEYYYTYGDGKINKDSEELKSSKEI